MKKSVLGSALSSLCDSSLAKVLVLASVLLGGVVSVHTIATWHKPAQREVGQSAPHGEAALAKAATPTTEVSERKKSLGVYATRAGRTQSRSTTQTSFGTQSPNVADVGGNVDIRYGSQDAGNAAGHGGK
jgi:hypothetical protein